MDLVLSWLNAHEGLATWMGAGAGWAAAAGTIAAFWAVVAESTKTARAERRKTISLLRGQITMIDATISILLKVRADLEELPAFRDLGVRVLDVGVLQKAHAFMHEVEVRDVPDSYAMDGLIMGRVVLDRALGMFEALVQNRGAITLGDVDQMVTGLRDVIEKIDAAWIVIEPSHRRALPDPNRS